MNMNRGLTRREFLKGIGGAAVSLSLLGAFQWQTKGAGATIGLLGTFTRNGQEVATGVELKRGAEFAVDVVNKGRPGVDLTIARGVKVRPLSLSLLDDEGNPDNAAKLVQAAKAAGAVGILGVALNHGSADRAAAEARNQGLPFIDATSVIPFLTRQGYETYFRMPSHELMALYMFFRAASDFKVKERDFLYVAEDRVGFDEDIEMLKEAIAPFEIKFTVRSFKLPVGITEEQMREQAAAIRAQKPDAVVFNLDGSLIAVVAKDFVANIPTVEERPALVVHEPFMLNIETLMERLTLEERTGQKWVFTNLQYLVPDMSAAPEALQKLNEEFKAFGKGGDFAPLSFLAFTGVQAWAMALHQIGRADAQGVLELLASEETIIPANELLLDAWGDVAFGPFDEFRDLGQNYGASPITARIDEEGNFEISPVGVSPLYRNRFIQIANFICSNGICGSF